MNLKSLSAFVQFLLSICSAPHNYPANEDILIRAVHAKAHDKETHKAQAYTKTNHTTQIL